MACPGPAHLRPVFLAAALAAMLVGDMGSLRAQPAPPVSAGIKSIEIHARTLDAFKPDDPSLRRFGLLEFRGGLVLTSPHRGFGGLSAIRVDAKGEGFVAVTDHGDWLTGRIAYQGRQPVALHDVKTAPMQNAIGEHMAAFEVARDLDFIDRKKRDVEITRHRFDRRDPVARLRRLDLLLTGDQRNGIRARAISNLVVDLARQKPQRQSDDARRMREHPLDGQMRFAGVGGPQHGGDASARRAVARTGGKESRLGHETGDSGLMGGVVYHNATVSASRFKAWNESGTNHARIADSAPVQLRSPPDVGVVQAAATI